MASTSRKKTGDRARAPDRPLECATAADWHAWLAKHHVASSGVWLLIAKQGCGRKTPTYAEAVEGALAWGWIDSQKQKHDDTAWLQRFTPRKPQSPWSRINRDKATALIASRKMEAPGLAEIERAKRDGRWEAAYDSARSAKIPADLAAALAANERAASFFADIDAANRYAILWRLQTAKKPETRARRLARFVAMLARHERIHALPERTPRAGVKRRSPRRKS